MGQQCEDTLRVLKHLTARQSLSGKAPVTVYFALDHFRDAILAQEHAKENEDTLYCPEVCS